MSQILKFGSGVIPPGTYIQEILGDVGSVSGAVISFNATPTAGSSVSFDGSGTTMLLLTSDDNGNTTIGHLAGNTSITGTNNAGYGYSALSSLTTGGSNTAVGFSSGNLVNTGSSNVFIGNDSGQAISTGSNNIQIGKITGTTNESNITRIGNTGITDECFILGIGAVNVGSVANVVVENNDQLGTAVLAAGANISITAGPNVITIASTGGGGGGITTLDGDTGSATGTTVTLTGASTGLTFTGSSATVTLGGTLDVPNGGTGTTTFTSHGVLLGNATSAVTTTAAGTTGQVLTGVTSSDPIWASPAASSISITGNTGGSLVGNAFTFTGGTTGLTFAGAVSTETLGGTLVVSNGGTGSTTLTGVLVGNGTSPVTANAITQYNTLVAGTSNSIVSIPPSATTGVPLISQGSTTNPTYGTALVVGGGTGSILFTAYAPVCGGTTTTGALQSAATGISNVGYVLTSTGSTSLPTWQASSGGGGITIIDGDSGSATGGTITLTGGSTGLTFTGSSSTITLAGDLDVSNGGTGTTTFTSHGVLLGNTTSALTATAAGTTGQILTGVTGSAPVWASPAASSISITGNSGGALVGSAFTFTGGTTGLTFAGSGSTETLGGTLVVANGGTGATTLTGVLIGNGTSAVTGNPVTQHDVLIGGASNAITSITPSATSGVPLVSQGSSSDPAFGTAVVAGGGTGNTTFTAYSVLCAGTTATGSFQNVSGLGTSGQVLTSNGAAALPTWQAGGGGGGGITTINGDVGSVTGSTVTIKTDASVGNYAGSTIQFVSLLDGVTLILNVSDNNSNTLLGHGAGNLTISGVENSGFGGGVLSEATSASYNAGFGEVSLGSLTEGNNNMAIGFEALAFLDSGSYNIAIGYQSGTSYTTTESSNICIGDSVVGVASESNTLRIGSATGTSEGNLDQSFICGIQGITVVGSAVLVSSSDQLGVAVSSRKYKENIENMADSSSAVIDLRPVTFTLKDNSDQSIQFGLIAEEVAEILPELVINDKNGEPQTVKYHELPVLLLNEFQKALKRIEVLENLIKDLSC